MTTRTSLPITQEDLAQEDCHQAHQAAHHGEAGDIPQGVEAAWATQAPSSIRAHRGGGGAGGVMPTCLALGGGVKRV